MKKKILLSLLASSLLSAQTIELKPLSITSTAVKTDELRSTDAVEIYTAKDIQDARVQNLYEFLNQRTSVTTMPSYGNPFMQKLDIRGYGINDGYQNIVVTINGRKINNIDMVPPLLSTISPASIERIEIIKSSGIVKGGDGANAGIINILTKEDSHQEISVYKGNYGAAGGSFYMGHGTKKLFIGINGEARKSDGIRNINDNAQKEKNSMTTGSLDIVYTPIEALRLRAAASFARTAADYASSLTLDAYNENPKQRGSSISKQHYDTNLLTLGMDYYINDKTSLLLEASREKKESLYDYKSTFFNYSNSADYEYDSLRSTLDYSDDLVHIALGYDRFDGNLVNTNNDLTKTNDALFFMSELYAGKSRIKLGYRYEEISFKSKTGEDQKDELHGFEAGYSYRIDKESSLFANYAHTFQSSSLDRLFSWISGAFTGYVKPSQADNYTIGFSRIVPDNKFKVSLFYSRLKDEIYYYADPTYMNSRNTNIDQSHKYGLDVYDKWLISDSFHAVFNYNYVQAKIDEEIENGEDYSSNDLPGVSDHNIKATLSYLPNKSMMLSLTQIYRSKAYAADDFTNSFTQKQEAYTSTNLSVSYTQNHIEFFAKINNLFNRKNGLWTQDDAIYPVNFTTTAMIGFKVKM